MENTLGLVMTGGGARGAYQAGVLKRIGEIKRVQSQGNPFPIIGGASAGAVNGAALAAGCDNFAVATQVLAGLWSRLKPNDIFRCDVISQARNSITWILDLSFGAVLGGGNARSLLDASPLQRYLKRTLIAIESRAISSVDVSTHLLFPRPTTTQEKVTCSFKVPKVTQCGTAVGA